MKLVWPSAAFVLFVLVVPACGGSDDDPRLTAVVEFDMSEVPQEGIDEITSRLVDIIDQRIRDLGGSSFDATISEPSTISFEFAGLDAEVASVAFQPGFLEFREPRRSVDGLSLYCEKPGGSEFYVQPPNVTEDVDDSGQKQAVCVGAAGETGAVVWDPAVAPNAEGEITQMTGAYLKSGGTEVLTEPGQCVPACLLLQFSFEGQGMFFEITKRLIDYPLGFFLDSALLTAPTVRTSIGNGRTIITGLTEQEAEALSAQLNSGPLPAPVKLISMEEVP